MTIVRFVCTLFASLLTGLLAASAQQSLPAISPPSRAIALDVVVNTRSGQPVANLRQQDFTILDNKSPRPITSFKVMTAADEPVKVILLIDAVNMPYEALAYARNGVTKFLHSNEGKLAYPTSIAVLTDDGVKIEDSFSTDGNALGDSLAHHPIGLREINRFSEWGAPERQQICINALQQLLTYVSPLPGRKLVLWISPGWPLISGPEVYLDSKDEERVFDEVVFLSTHLRQANLTLYNINPWGVSEPMLRATFYETFLKGAPGPEDVQLGNLGLQVLAI